MSGFRSYARRTVVERRAVDDLGRPGPFVYVLRELGNGDTIEDWFTPGAALRLADELRRAAT